MGTRHKNSFALKDRTVFASGQTLALKDITAVRRKSQYKPRVLGLILLFSGLLLWAWGWRDETAQQQNRQAKFARDYAEAEQNLDADGGTSAMDGIHPLDITGALQTDTQLIKWGAGLAAVGFVYAFARRRQHRVIVTTGGHTFPIYRAKSLPEANQIVEEIAAKMG